ncbi:hypothetical protein [uncultured Aquimarina sp.]|nr:hypothetical protein [uncultured Aquimarina sp.]
MLRSILKENGVQEIKKNQQKSINGGFGNSCAQAISLDGKLCLCINYIPQGNICVLSNE